MVTPSRASALLFLLICAVSSVRAETVLFLHGHLGGVQNWRGTGITASVEAAGWHDAGTLRIKRDRVSHGGTQGGAAQRFFTLELNGQSELQHQAAVLGRYVEWVRQRFPNTPLILIGHSAGGLVARLYMVQNPDANVAALITIATPHLGTPIAQVSEFVEQSPLAWLVPMMGVVELNEALDLYRDLAIERPGNFLYQLNRRPHPPARYISIVRAADRTNPLGDVLVPGWSQDMRSVKALTGQVRTVHNRGTHALAPADGEVLIRLLQWLQQA